MVEFVRFLNGLIGLPVGRLERYIPWLLQLYNRHESRFRGRKDKALNDFFKVACQHP